jgi:hypothetical protein
VLPRRPFLGLLVRDSEVVGVWPGSSAEHAGIAVGDCIEAIDDVAFDGDLPAAVRGRTAGNVLRIALAGKPTAAVPLRPWPAETTPGATTHYDHVTVADARLRTIATVPRAASRAPAVLLLPGLVSAAMDHAPEPDPAWRPIVVGLAAAGIISMRVERRGIGDSEGGPAEDVDFTTELAGYVAGARALLQLHAVDPTQLVLFGHSVGAMQAPLVAAEIPVRGIVAYGTTARRWSQNMIPLARRQLRVRGLADDGVAADARLAAAIASDGPTERTHIHGRPLAYLRQLDRTDVAAAWSRFDGDVLLLHGEHDVVSDAEDHAHLAALLRARGRGCLELRTLPSLGHTMLRVTDPRADLERPHDGDPTDFVAAALAGFLVWVGKLTT